MKKIWGLLPIVLCVTALAQNSPTSTEHISIYITHVVVIDTDTGRAERLQTKRSSFRATRSSIYGMQRVRLHR